MSLIFNSVRIVIALGLIETSQAQIHKCTAEDGTFVYQQEPCEIRGGKGGALKVFPSGGAEARGTQPWEGAPEVKLEPLPLSPDEARRLFEGSRSALVMNLKDPGSAIFQGVKVVRVRHAGEEATYICGMINAKNSYGGYTGFDLFFSDGIDMGITPADSRGPERSENFGSPFEVFRIIVSPKEYQFRSDVLPLFESAA